MLFEVAIRSPLRRLFTYRSEHELPRGIRVRVPFRSQKKVGFVWKKAEEAPSGLKTIEEPLDEKPLFDEKSLLFYEKASEYYGLSLGELLGSSLPRKIRDGAAMSCYPSKDFVFNLMDLSPAQQEIVNQVSQEQAYSVHLIFGETGSGKTEVYLELMKQVLQKGGQILFLVPEISLTPQLEDRLEKRLGAPVNSFHSHLKESKRLESFTRAWQGEADVFLGARSALFLPYQNLQLIIVDEEHDSSYKQSERAPYHARDLAVWRAKINRLPILLGSATPSIESYHRLNSPKHYMHRLDRYYQGGSLEIEVLDLKETWKTEAKSFLTPRLQQSLCESLERNEQALLFLNRRGSASQRICTQCGQIDECPHCSAKLTLHYDWDAAICHLCGYQEKIPQFCSSCNGDQFFAGGIGTKELEQQIRTQFPEARVARLDRDSVQRRAVLGDTLRAFERHEIDILIGTQMISKGLDVSKLSFLAMILADQGWGVPDFRSMERSFQMILQLLGRVGRRGQSAHCLIQTFSPEHPIFSLLKSSEPYERFAKQELELRSEMKVPPYSKLLLWTLRDRDEKKVEKQAHILAQRMRVLAQKLGVELIGPFPAPVYRWRAEYRLQILAKAPQHHPLTSFMTAVLDDIEKRPLSVKLRWDRDPYHFM